MGSVSSIFRLLRGAPPAADAVTASVSPPERIPRRSSGFTEFARAVAEAGEESLRVLDLGPTSPANITHLTGLGHKAYNDDILVASTDPALVITDEEGNRTLDVRRFLAENLNYERGIFDAVLCWDAPDYLPEVLVKPLVERLHHIMKPGGVLLGFFHTRDAGPNAPYYRYHIAGRGSGLELQPVWKSAAAGVPRVPQFRLQRVYANRHIENLFRNYNSLKFFLARDFIREVLAIR